MTYIVSSGALNSTHYHSIGVEAAAIDYAALSVTLCVLQT